MVAPTCLTRRRVNISVFGRAPPLLHPGASEISSFNTGVTNRSALAFPCGCATEQLANTRFIDSYRGLTVIHAPSAVERPAPGNIRRGLTTSSGWSESSNGSISSDASSSPSPSPSPPPQNTIPTALLVSSFPASAIVSRPLDGPATFSLPAPTSFKTVNLRNFALQGPKYASVSDIVVYGEHGIDESVVDVAIRVKEAQDIEWQRRGAQGVKYNVYVVSGEQAATGRRRRLEAVKLTLLLHRPIQGI